MDMLTVLLILGIICALCVVPFATVLGLIGVWLGGGVGAFIGIVIGLFWQAHNNS